MSMSTEGSTVKTNKMDWSSAFSLLVEYMTCKDIDRKAEIKKKFDEKGFTEDEINSKFRELGLLQ